MTDLVKLTPTALPDLVRAAGPRAETRFMEFFLSHHHNANTRKAYGIVVREFLTWCQGGGVTGLGDVQSLHVALYINELRATKSAPTVKQHLAAIRALYDWLVVGQVVPANPAASVRGPTHSVKRGKTPVLEPTEARQLLESIDTSTPIGLRDRALIGLMVYSFARVGAAVGMKVGDVYTQNHRLWVRLNEKGGKRHEMPCHHSLETYLRAYMAESGLGTDPKAPLFPTIGRGTAKLTTTPLPIRNALNMVQRRALAAGVNPHIGNHTFRATGITAYLKNGGTLEKAAHMANHASTRTTQLYDRRRDDVTLDEVERILI